VLAASQPAIAAPSGEQRDHQPAPGPRIDVKVTITSVKGSLLKRDARRSFAVIDADLRQCYVASTAPNAVTVDLVVEASAEDRPNPALITGKSMEERFGACLETAFKKLRFAAESKVKARLRFNRTARPPL